MVFSHYISSLATAEREDPIGADAQPGANQPQDDNASENHDGGESYENISKELSSNMRYKF